MHGQAAYGAQLAASICWTCYAGCHITESGVTDAQSPCQMLARIGSTVSGLRATHSGIFLPPTVWRGQWRRIPQGELEATVSPQSMPGRWSWRSRRSHCIRCRTPASCCAVLGPVAAGPALGRGGRRGSAASRRRGGRPPTAAPPGPAAAPGPVSTARRIRSAGAIVAVRVAQMRPA